MAERIIGLSPPSPFAFEGNLAESWKQWQKALDFYLTATESDSKSDKVKTSILLTCIGEKGREIYDTFEFENAGDKLKLKPVLKKFEEYCNPRSNTTFERHKFFTYRQEKGQTFTSFVTELKKRSAACEFDTLKDSLIKDMIICGISDNALRERMLREPNINLQKAVELGQASEQTKLHAQQLTEDMEKKIHKVHRQKREKERRDKNRDRFKSHSPERDNLIKNCKFCAGRHQRGKCPAYGQKCNKCQRRNHFARCCKQTVHQVDDSQDRASFESSSESDFVIESLVATESEAASEVQQALKIDPLNSDTSAGHWSVTLNAGSQDIPFKIDTGAQVNVLPKKLYNKLNPRPRIKQTSTKLSAYNGSSIPVHGKCIVPIQYKGQKHHLLFIVVASQTTPILGLATSERLNLIKRVYKITDTNIEEAYSSNISEEYADCFGEIGTLKSTYHMTLKDDVRPVVVPPRKVPFALKDRLKKELDRMESMGIIEKVEKSTDWVNALVLVEKPNGKLRVCLDPRPLNQAIKRQHYRLPTTEEIISQMSGARFFSKLDASNGYWQIAVDDFTSDLLTFGTAFGRYKFKRMPYGIHSASEIFQLEISKIIAGCDGAANSQDDIIVWGETKEIHDQRLKKILDKIRDSGLKLNHAKCIFGATELTFLGHIMSADGVKPDPRKIEAITKMPVPTSPAELQRFLGMVNYLGKFIPNLSDETAPLRALLKKGTEFLMQKPQIDAFEKLKRRI
ncbi:Hypothetical predicted protein [Paramuricea clavata]|uniref:Uncharacterized protein n=1 Tax=Paramuricea clavata TaxID=317549 RepID=A0A7D9EXE6_PARCT|nr:Hypothetical predicted protein [Paramuricea clavata]